MQRQLADAVLKTFDDAVEEQHFAALNHFSTQDWAESYRWLDANGLALYFLDRVKRLGVESALPPVVLARLEQNMADSRERTAENFAEFVRVSRASQESGISHIHIKGFATSADACPDPALRLQLDLDFLAPIQDAERCSEILRGFDYFLTMKSDDVWEFKSNLASMPQHADLYKPTRQRSIDMHIMAEGIKMPQRRWQERIGFRFPVLRECDRFLQHADHVMHHLNGEWVRLSWLLELRRNVMARSGDEVFWSQVRQRTDDSSRVAIGASIAMATIAFGEFASAELKSWTVDMLDRRMRLWIKRYGREVVLADFPGTKLYLLQPSTGVSGLGATKKRRELLLPLHRIPRVVRLTETEDWWTRMHALMAQISFAMFRLRFHLTEGWRYLLEAPRWKRIVKAEQQ